LFSTGVCNAEAIGLRVKHLHITNKRVEISETIARTLKGTNHAARIQKGTKTDKSRWLSLSDELVELLGKIQLNVSASNEERKMYSWSNGDLNTTIMIGLRQTERKKN